MPSQLFTRHPEDAAIDAARVEFPEWERKRSGRFNNGAGPEGGYDPVLVNTEVFVSRALRAGDNCAVDYFRVKLWNGIAYMHMNSGVPAEFRIHWDDVRAEEILFRMTRMNQRTGAV